MSIIDNYKKILNDVNKAACGRNVTILPVSKTHSAEKIEELVNFGVNIFGENKVQEALDKLNILKPKYKDIEFHYIGKVQSNKLKKIVENFSLIHSVDRIDILDKIDKYSKDLNKKQNILLQVNIACEKQKNGISVSLFDELFHKSQTYNNIITKGLMFMPPYEEDVSKNIHYFQEAYKIYEKYSSISKDFNILSMGMSHDFNEALKEGANLVRVGTNIFGNRSY